MKAAVAALFLVMTATPMARAQETPGRLVAFLVPVRSDAPLFDGDGTLANDAPAIVTAARNAIRPLQNASQDVPFALAVSGLFCDELRAYGSRAAKAMLSDIRRLAVGRDVVTINYSETRLHDVPFDELATDIAEGATAIERCTGREPIDVLAAPDGAPPDSNDLDVLADVWPRTIITAYASPTPQEGSKLMYLPTISRENDRPGAPAVIAEEIDTSVLDDESIDVVPLRELVGRHELSWTTGEFYEPPPTSSAQGHAVESAAMALAIFDGMTTTDNPLRDVFRTVLAHIRGDASQPHARANAEALARAVARIAGRVGVDDGSVTFTSRSGDVPVTISNANDFPVSVKVELLSSKVDFEQRTRDVVIDPPGDTVTFKAQAKSSGSFPITVRLVIRRQGLIDDAVISVRSTAVNISAVVLTAGGALYVAYWLIRRLRRTGFHIAAPPEDAP